MKVQNNLARRIDTAASIASYDRICTNPPKMRQNTITRYSFLKEDLYGYFDEDKSRYDLISVIMIGLIKDNNYNKNMDDGEESIDSLIKMLSTLLSKEIKPEEKKNTLTKEFGITMSEEMEGGLNDMCNLGQGVYDEGVMESIKKLMKNTGWNIDKCMDMLDIPSERRERYKYAIQNTVVTA